MTPRIAEVAIPISIALNEQFDYSIPNELLPSVRVGSRVLVPFRASRVIGYVVGLKKHSDFKGRLRPIIKNLDLQPLLDKELMELAYEIHRRYLCSLADAIATVAPTGLKTLKNSPGEHARALDQDMPVFELTSEESSFINTKELKEDIVLVHDLSNKKRWDIYSALIKNTLNEKRSVIFLVPDHQKIAHSLNMLALKVSPYTISSSASTAESLRIQKAIRVAEFCFVAGTRSAIFAPVHNLGLVIMEEEEHFAYRQDQVPHYRCHDMAFFRTGKAGAQLVLGSFTPSLESYQLTKQKKASYLRLQPLQALAPVKIIDTKQEYGFKGREPIISRFLEHRIADILERRQKILVFVNKKGFSTFLFCRKCKKTQTCPQCSSFLVYHFKERTVSCPTCTFKEATREVCPDCQSSYVKYSGFGLEKVESEILRLFPSARLFVYDKGKPIPQVYDIMLATSGLLEYPLWSGLSFDGVSVIAFEQMLRHVDFRATEKAFARLQKLNFMAGTEMIIQTQVSDNSALTYLKAHDALGFFEQELTERQDLGLPPITAMAALMIRSREEKKAHDEAYSDYRRLKGALSRLKIPGQQNEGLLVLEPIAAQPLKVRGNYRYEVHIKYKNLEPLQKILRSIIETRRKGVIATLDPSPL